MAAKTMGRSLALGRVLSVIRLPKERILEIYDAMLAAQRSGQPYQTALNPPPGEGPRATEV
jgi:hypothetical protein